MSKKGRSLCKQSFVCSPVFVFFFPGCVVGVDQLTSVHSEFCHRGSLYEGQSQHPLLPRMQRRFASRLESKYDFLRTSACPFLSFLDRQEERFLSSDRVDIRSTTSMRSRTCESDATDRRKEAEKPTSAFFPTGMFLFASGTTSKRTVYELGSCASIHALDVSTRRLSGLRRKGRREKRGSTFLSFFFHQNDKRRGHPAAPSGDLSRSSLNTHRTTILLGSQKWIASVPTSIHLLGLLDQMVNVGAHIVFRFYRAHQPVDMVFTVIWFESSVCIRP